MCRTVDARSEGGATEAPLWLFDQAEAERLAG